MQIDMTGENRRKMLQVTFQDQVSRRPQVIKCSLHVAGIPNSNDVEQEAQTGGAIELTGEIAVGQDPKLSVGDKACQAMHQFSLVEQASHASSVWLAEKARQDSIALSKRPYSSRPDG